ncbi:MAG TPA: class I SAM-dependent methyltransferase, partial [Pseudonocardiaceae bacterium]|nr:class I SAM-dependent methyltransferase [Pseudonocardiaceae bacterium]
MIEPQFDRDMFDEDYLYFYESIIGHVQSDADVALIWRLLDPGHGIDVLDLPCGHGRIANRLAARSCRVTGVDIAPAFLDRARQDAAERGVAVDYRHGDMRALPWAEHFDIVVNWFTSFGYFGDKDNMLVLREIAKVLRPGGR